MVGTLHITATRYPDLVVSCRFGGGLVFVVAASLAGVVSSTAASIHAQAQSVPPVVVQPAAPGQPGRAAAAKPGAPPAVSPADVTFMQGMIGHHAQAIDMTALVDSHTTSKDMTLLAKRISVSQTDEIKSMQRWLEAHGQSVPGEHAHHMMMAEGHLMPGMLTEAEMSQLAAAKGVAFDRLFLQFMIKHHEGALVMVKELFASVGAAQDANVFAFASDVDADQRMEISRMRAMLTSR